jgi:hypothetical protein
VISFMRWSEGDIETIAPSLYASRMKGSRKTDPAQPETAPSAPGTSLPANPASPASGAVTPSVTPPVAPGLPGSSPFAGGN